jgi:hypothetical protein
MFPHKENYASKICFPSSESSILFYKLYGFIHSSIVMDYF